MVCTSFIAAGRTPMSYTLAKAAKACGVNKSAVKRAVKDGRISGTKDDRGIWLVEAAELHRIFPPVASAAASTEALPPHSPPDAVTNTLVAELRTVIERSTATSAPVSNGMTYAANELGEQIEPAQPQCVQSAAARTDELPSAVGSNAMPGAAAAAVTNATPRDATADAPPNDAELRRRVSLAEQLAEQRLYDRLADLQAAVVDMQRDRDAWREQAQRSPASEPSKTWWRRWHSRRQEKRHGQRHGEILPSY
jgi:hypothetical protein